MTYDRHMKTLRPNKCNRCLSVSNVSKDETRNTEIVFRRQRKKNRKVTHQKSHLVAYTKPRSRINNNLTQQVETLNLKKDHGFCSQKKNHGHTDSTSRPSWFVHRESFKFSSCMVLIWALYYTLSLLSHIVHVMKGKSITCGKVS